MHALEMLEVNPDLLGVKDAADLSHQARHRPRELLPLRSRLRKAHELLTDEVIQSRDDPVLLSHAPRSETLLLPNIRKSSLGHVESTSRWLPVAFISAWPIPSKPA